MLNPRTDLAIDVNRQTRTVPSIVVPCEIFNTKSQT